MKKLFLFAAIALFAVASVDAQRYFSKAQKDRTLADVPTFHFDVGEGVAADTADLSTSAEYDMQLWDGVNEFEVSNLNVAIQSGVGDDTLGIQICFSDTIGDATPLVLTTAAVPVDSTLAAVPGGYDVTTFSDATIPTGYYVWLKVSNLTGLMKPTQVVVTVTGHMQDNNGN